MGFDYNPYRHFEIVAASPNGTTFKWICHNCGGEGKIIHSENAPIKAITDDYKNHLATSHRKSPSDFQGWSDF